MDEMKPDANDVTPLRSQPEMEPAGASPSEASGADGAGGASRGRAVSPREVVRWSVPAAVLLVYIVFVAFHFHSAIVAPDANGYWAQGSLLACHGRTWFEPESS
ncbi:MAG: hypothetical protein KAI66_20565, partial [Lentisphaeria bacterium]|nr:hypothetical protein [Lentisphaeria bacterium]